MSKSHPVPGDKAIDASDLETVDLTPDQISKKTKVREGFDEAVAALTRLTPDQIQMAGINGVEVQRILALKADYDRCNELLPATEKLVELLRETRLERGHQISIVLSEIVAQARRRSERDPKAAEVLGILQDLTDYVTGPAAKAAATRAKLAKTADGNGTPPAAGNGAGAPETVSTP